MSLPYVNESIYLFFNKEQTQTQGSDIGATIPPAEADADGRAKDRWQVSACSRPAATQSIADSSWH